MDLEEGVCVVHVYGVIGYILGEGHEIVKMGRRALDDALVNAGDSDVDWVESRGSGDDYGCLWFRAVSKAASGCIEDLESRIFTWLRR